MLAASFHFLGCPLQSQLGSVTRGGLVPLSAGAGRGGARAMGGTELGTETSKAESKGPEEMN